MNNRKKGAKVAVIAAGAVIALLLVVEWAGSPVAKLVIENHSEAWIGRQVRIERLHVNPFIGSLHIQGLHCSDAIGAEREGEWRENESPGEFVGIDDLYVRVSLVRLLGKNVYLKHIHLSNFNINIWSTDTCFNFSDLPARFSSPDSVAATEQDTTPSAWRVALNDIRLHGGNVAYTDKSRGQHWALENVNLYVPGLFLGDRQTDAGLSLDLPDDGGNIRLKGAYNMSSNFYSVVADLRDIDLRQAEPILKEQFNLHSLHAWLNGHLNASGSLDEIMNVRVHGSLTLRDLDLMDDKRETQLTMREASVRISEISPGPMVFRFDTVLLDSINLHYTRATALPADTAEVEDEDFQESAPELAKEDSRERQEERSDRKPSVLVRKFILKNSEIHYTDKTLFSKFKYDITGIRGGADNITLDGDNHLVVNGRLPHGGSFMANWRGGIDLKRDNVRIVAMLKNVQLEDLSPWVEYLFAYKVKGGTLSAASDNTIQGGVIDGTQKIEIYNFKLGRRNERLAAEMKSVPLKLGIELLTDFNGKISLDVPIKGDVNSPRFSFGKIVGRAIGNVLLKATAAPFAAIATAADREDAGDLTQIHLDMLQPDFSLEQYKKLDLLAGMLKEHPDLSLTLCQQFNLRNAVEERAVFKLKKQYYETCNESVGSGPLTLIDIQKIRNVKTNGAFNSFAEPLIGKRGSLADRAVAYYTVDSLTTEVMRFADMRNRFVVRYLTEQQGVSKQQVEALTAPEDELMGYKGKSRYEVRGKSDKQE